MAQREISCGSYHLTRADNNGNKCIDVEIGRKLTSSETNLAKEMFGNSIEYTKVHIYDRKWAFFQGKRVAMTPNGNIYFAPDVYTKDFSLASASTKHFFIHEMTHVWQYQNGQAVLTRAGTSQMLIELPSKVGLGNGAYTYQLDVRKDLLDYGIEQQASIVADYWAMKNGLHVELRNSIRATNRNDSYLTHYRIIVDTVVKK